MKLLTVCLLQVSNPTTTAIAHDECEKLEQGAHPGKQFNRIRVAIGEMLVQLIKFLTI